jgi:type IV secretory pathway VirB2 component (pilin)
MNKSRILALGITLAMIPLAAHAQAVGGGGLDAFATWLAGPIGRPVTIIGAVVVGIIFCVGRRDWEHMVNYAIGAAVIGAAVTLGAQFAGGG